MKRIAELFSEHYEPGYYKLIDKTHPLSLYIGADLDGHYAIEYRGDFKPLKVKSSTAIGVTHFETDKNKSVVFSLLDSSMLSTFCAFCEDMVETTRLASDNNSGYTLLINRFYAWKKMFHQAANLLDEKRIMGLIGELLFLQQDMIPKYGKSKALGSWTGTEKTKKDFSIDGTWYEVKAITAGKSVVGISSYEQLDSEVPGNLVVFQLEKMSPEYNGISLNKLVKQIYQELDVEALKDLFLQKLSDAGYTFESAYDSYVYVINSESIYEVNQSFPCLRREEKLDAIVQVKYDLLLAKIEQFKIK